MSNPSLFVSLLVRQAARNLHRLEVLTEHPDWTNWVCRWHFWRTRRMMAVTPDEAAAWLPALAFALSCEKGADVLAQLARQSLPEPLPPEAIPWRDRLIQVWEQYPADTTWEKTIRLAALVRLDRRVERLPEWLREARRALDLLWYDRPSRLAALAGWRPRPGDGPPHGDKAEAARAWVRFWEERYRTSRSEPDGLIATAALLHLAEAGWLPSGPSPERLREEFRMACLELTRKDVDWEKRAAVWDMLAAWQRKGVLERCGIDREQLQELSLLPDLARTLEWERNDDVLLTMAGYIPGAVEVSAHPEAARAVVARWEALGRNDDWGIRRAAWVARWNLRRAGVLTAEEQGRFDADCMEAIGAENNQAVLLALAQITPPGTFPLAIWTRRLSDQDDRCRLAARLAIHGWLVDMASSEWRVASSELRVARSDLPLATHHSPLAITRWQMRQALRRAGQEGAARTVVPFVNLPREVQPDFRRLHEIETALAAGHLPPSPDAGAGNRPIPRTGPARLPEAHPRTGPPGITDRTTGRIAGSEPSARHPFPEAGRHE